MQNSQPIAFISKSIEKSSATFFGAKNEKRKIKIKMCIFTLESRP
jgi:hypothetical protein